MYPKNMLVAAVERGFMIHCNMSAKEIDWKIKKEHLIMKCERSLNEKKSKSAKDREKGVADIWSMIAFFINPMQHFSIIYLENGHIIFAKRR